MKCFAEKYCKKDRSECSEVCGGYRVLRALYSLSRIPQNYRYNIPLVPDKQDMRALETLNDYMQSIITHVEAGEGLYIWSEVAGNGKTSWACKIMGYYFRKIAFHSGLENEGLYIYTPTFLEDLRAYYDDHTPDFEEILEMAKSCRLLIIDDIGAERLSEWVSERLLSLINTRVSNGLCTIYTSNLSPDELTNKLGARLASRIIGYSKQIALTGGDRRGM